MFLELSQNLIPILIQSIKEEEFFVLNIYLIKTLRNYYNN